MQQACWHTEVGAIGLSQAETCAHYCCQEYSNPLLGCRPAVCCRSSCLVAAAAVPGVHSSMHAMASSQFLQAKMGE
jgi:hypothetical protein